MTPTFAALLMLGAMVTSIGFAFLIYLYVTMSVFK